MGEEPEQVVITVGDDGAISVTTGAVPSLADCDISDLPAPESKPGAELQLEPLRAASGWTQSACVWITETREPPIGSQASTFDASLPVLWLAHLEEMPPSGEVVSGERMRFAGLEPALAWARRQCDVVRVQTVSGSFTAGSRAVPGMRPIDEWFDDR